MEENTKRREDLFNLMDDNSVAVIFSGVSKIATADELYPFKVNTSFFYLTNVKQENSTLLLVKTFGETKTYLFVDEYDEVKEKWTGKRLTFKEASELSNIQNVISSKEFNAFLDLVLTKENNQYGPISKCYIDLTEELKVADALSSKMLCDNLKNKHAHIEYSDVIPFLTTLRMVKSEYEVECIKKAVELTNNGINHLLKNMKVGNYEYEVSDDFEAYGRQIGARNLAFATIVASGKNATCLHYPQQQERIPNDCLVLFDLGYSYAGYSGDISRTYPINGKFEGVQKLIYTAVLNCNKAVIEYVHAGQTIADIQTFTKEFLKNECVRLGLMNEDEDIIKYYYHGVSHHLGLDTHDLSDRNKPFEPGNVITVEPGLYFAQHNCGVRIEDDVLITDTQAVNLSSQIAKEIADVEKLLKNR